MRKRTVFLAILGWFCLLQHNPVWSQNTSHDLTSLSLEDLMNVQVYSASKKNERLFDTAAAIYVINPEDIRRSGATSIPELLRMVPGINVQKVNAHGWDISARGFNGSIYANKLLVLIDGRAVYTPLYGGVFWDVQDVVLEDIERIEVIRGPGGALWGANAVNGVINVITKRAQDTQGTLVSIGGGTEERGFATGRYGGKSKDWYYRSYAKYFNRDEGFRSNGTANDQSQIARTGFRADRDQLTFQGDFYKGEVGQIVNVVSGATTTPSDKNSYVEGWNLLSRYSQDDWSLQMYWDVTDRNLQIFSERRQQIDVEFTRQFEISPNQEINWGAGYRLNLQNEKNASNVTIRKAPETDQIFNFFVQDQIKFLDDRLKLTLGSKLEHNIYTGFEVQPNVRLSYDINERSMVWGAASRAIRTPSRIERDGIITAAGGLQGVGNEDLTSEEMRGFELGYRNQILENTLLDLAVFTNHYDDLISYIRTNGIIFPTANGLRADTYGAELAADTKIKEWWNIKSAYTYTKMNVSKEESFNSVTSESTLEEAVPQHSVYLRSSFDLPKDLELDTTFRYTNPVSGGRIHAMTQIDINLTKKMKGGWEASLIGQNLLQNHHRESNLSTATQVERSVYAKITRRF